VTKLRVDAHMSVPEAAALYFARGWHPLPLRFGQKELRDKDGLTRTYTAEDFTEQDNIGLCLISARDLRPVKLIAIDFDAPEITPSAVWAFFPKTCGWGRESKPISQLLYTASYEKSVQVKDLGHKDPKRQTLVEVRATHQSMCPPSIHPNGESVLWIAESESLEALALEPIKLNRAVSLIATYALMARYYPVSGARHFWGLYLAGLLNQLALTQDEATACFKLAGEFNHDGDIKDRLDAVRTTFAKPDDDPVGGTQKLIEDMGDDVGQAFVKSLKKIWGGSSGSGFGTGARGNVVANSLSNIQAALKRLGIVLSEDRFKQRMLMSHGGASAVLDDASLVRVWLEVEREFGFRPAKDFFWDVLANEARKNPFHPVRDYLDALTWDGAARLDKWLVTYGGAPDSAYVKAVSAIVLIAAVRRVRQPGCKFDELLILESDQGTDKSSAMRALCPNEDWFSDDLPLNVDAKQIIERTAGRWIIEIAELVGAHRKDIDHLKASLSRQVDGPVRLAYARLPIEVPRQFIIIGTTNPGMYLRDITGNRRFWPVVIEKFHVEELRRNRDQLWAEAAAREAQGASIRLDPKLYAAAAEHQEERRTEDPWETDLEELIAGIPVKDLGNGFSGQRLASRVVWEHLGISAGHRDSADMARIGAIMRRLGFVRTMVRVGKATIRGWERRASSRIWDEKKDEQR